MSELESFRNHCRRMALDNATAPAEATLWRTLADEIDAYLGDDVAQEALL